MPFNGSIFDVRNKYAEIFPELGDPVKERHNDSEKQDKYYKINYILNLLPDLTPDKDDG